MPALKEYLHRRLTGREIAVVTAILGVLGGLCYAGYEFAAAKLLEARVNQALPKVCGAVRNERQELVTAIEAYKARFGLYPPDHVLTRQPCVVDPVTNTLLYELVGVLYNPVKKMYQVAGLEPAEEQYVKEFFHISAFKNCGETPDKITRFLKINPVPVLQLHDDPDVFVVGFQAIPEGVPYEVFWQFQIASWRYVSSSPTNNPGKFDLWTEVETKTRKVLIGNWKAVD